MPVDPNAPTEALPDPLPSDEREGLPADLGGCRIVREIGRCGMGIVFEAYQHSPRRAVALKVMREVKEGAPLERFLNEAQMLAQLRHPSITQVYRSGVHEQDGRRIPWFVMEYVPNAHSLTEHARAKTLSLRDRIELFLSVCDAVHHGHLRGIVHRDLKPDNILVDGDDRVKVIDFGIAKALGGGTSLRHMESQFGVVLGTLPYMAPEQVEADPGQVDARCDVYALGIVLYELLCGIRPYVVPRTPLTDAIRAIQTTLPRTPHKVNPDVRGDLETILLAALEKDRRRRYQSADALAAELRRFLEGKPIERAPASPARRVAAHVRSFAVRKPVLATIATIALTLLVVPAFLVPLVHLWTDVDQSVMRTFATHFAPLPDIDRFRDVRVVRGTEEDCEAIARELGLDDVTKASPRTFRRLHGRLMERLASAGVSVVAWDITFADASDFDADLARGVDAVRAADGDVVIAVLPWPLDPAIAPGISPALVPNATWGGITARAPRNARDSDVELPVTMELAVRRGKGDPIPHLAIVTALAHRTPHRFVTWRIDPLAGNQLVEARVHTLPRERAHEARYERSVPFVVTATLKEPQRDDPSIRDTGIVPGDVVVDLLAPIPPQAELDAITTGYAEVFAMDDAALRRAFRDRIVVVAPVKPAGIPAEHPDSDMHVISRGRRVFGVYLHATVIDLLLRDAILRAAPPNHLLAMQSSAVVIGALAAWATGRRRWRRLVLAAALTALACGLALLAYDRAGYIANPIVPVITLLATMLLVGWIVEARARALR